MRSIKILSLVSLLFFIGCDERQADLPVCGKFAFVSSDQFDNAINRGDFFIQSARIEDDCLLMSVRIGTCDINDTEVELVDSGSVTNSGEHHRTLRLLLDTDDSCNVDEIVTLSFDLRPLRITEAQEVILNIQTFGEAITYTY
ncbi:hypothetical protein [Pseudotenacibaculum haliotis]|uniref:Lipoprotein n=1 Tax=Pseudotenacibaculum haliotis TaxID=1862138 RepID=A0ABW5LY69_9FLAO